jgi:hypothetical protein
VWTKDVHRAHRIAARIRAGTVWIDAYRVVAPTVPADVRQRIGHELDLDDPRLDSRPACVSTSPPVPSSLVKGVDRGWQMGRLRYAGAVALVLAAVPARAVAAPSLVPDVSSLPPGTSTSLTGTVDQVTADATPCVVQWDQATPSGPPPTCTWVGLTVTVALTVPADAAPGEHVVTALYASTPVRLRSAALEIVWEITAPVVVQTRVPDTVAMTADVAASTLRQAGLLARMTVDAAAEPSAWRVVAQKPPGPGWADPGSEVVLGVEPLAAPATSPPATVPPATVPPTTVLPTTVPPLPVPTVGSTSPGRLPPAGPTTRVRPRAGTTPVPPVPPSPRSATAGPETRPVSSTPVPVGGVAILAAGGIFVAGWLWRSRRRAATPSAGPASVRAPVGPFGPVRGEASAGGVPLPRESAPPGRTARPGGPPGWRLLAAPDRPRVRIRSTSTEPAIAVRLDLRSDPGQQTVTEEATR